MKKIALIGIVLSVCFVFAGCAKQSANTDNADSSNNSSQVNVPPVPPDPIEE